MNRPELGQKVRASSIAIKVRKGNREFFKVDWIPEEKEITGIYTGYRTVYRGRVKTDYGRYFTPSVSLELWLIVIDPRKNPIHVFPEDCEIVQFMEWKASTHANMRCTNCEKINE